MWKPNREMTPSTSTSSTGSWLFAGSFMCHPLRDRVVGNPLRCPISAWASSAPAVAPIGVQTGAVVKALRHGNLIEQHDA